jgi:putative hydrolase
MQFVADLHVHTVASGHAYSTVLEVARAAADRGLALIAITDHGPAMPGGPHAYHFSNQFCMPESLFGVRVLKGVEANVMDRDGTLDLDEGRLAKMEIVLAGLHTLCAPYGSVAENTAMMINTIKNPWVDVIVHPGNPEYLIDEEAVVRAAAEHGVALEINNSSLTVPARAAGRIATISPRWRGTSGCKILLGTDSHLLFGGRFSGPRRRIVARKLLRREEYPHTSVEGSRALSGGRREKRPRKCVKFRPGYRRP